MYTAYLLHGYIPSDMLDTVRMSGINAALLPFKEGEAEDVAAAAEAGTSTSTSAAALEPQPGSPGEVPATRLYDYLTPQYQQVRSYRL